jgi:hypothetical protein
MRKSRRMRDNESIARLKSRIWRTARPLGAVFFWQSRIGSEFFTPMRNRSTAILRSASTSAVPSSGASAVVSWSNEVGQLEGMVKNSKGHEISPRLDCPRR